MIYFSFALVIRLTTYKTIVLHLVIWLAYLSTLVIGAEQLHRSFWVYLLSVKLPLIITFYALLYYAFPTFLATAKYVSLIFSVVLIFATSIVLRFLLLGALEGFDILTEAGDAEINHEFWKHFRLCLGFMAVSLAVYYFKQHAHTSQYLVEAELKSLKHQINPHFLYNTLNYFYSKSLPTSPEVARGIGILSELMRYSIGGAEGRGYSTLEEEVKQINHLIELQQLRFNQNLHIRFQSVIEHAGQPILQMVLMGFVENAFKHGELQNKEHPIDIDLRANKKELIFSVRNKISSRPNDLASGIGLPNTFKRLELAYPGKHKLEIRHDKEIYSIFLSLQW